MKIIIKIALMILCFTLLGCSKFTEFKKRRHLSDVPIVIVPSHSVSLSNCMISFKAKSESILLRDNEFRFQWEVNGDVVADSGENMFVFSKIVDSEETVNISVVIESDEYYGTATYSFVVRPHPFRNPVDSNYFFSEEPVLLRGENHLVDPGSILYSNGEFHCFYNGIFQNPEIYGGYAVSDDGMQWEIISDYENPVFTRKQIADISGRAPANFHMKTVLEENGIWSAWFTYVIIQDPFYGRIYRAVSHDPLGPWVMDEQPTIRSDHESWEGHYIGLPQVFKLSDQQYVLYYVTTAGDVGLAESTDGVTWNKNPDPLLKVIRPCIVNTDWGWVLISQNDIYLSLDGKEWHQYNEKLYSSSDAQSRGIVNNILTTAFIHDQKYYCYFEGISSDTGSDVYLITWDE